MCLDKKDHTQKQESLSMMYSLLVFSAIRQFSCPLLTVIMAHENTLHMSTEQLASISIDRSFMPGCICMRATFHRCCCILILAGCHRRRCWLRTSISNCFAFRLHRFFYWLKNSFHFFALNFFALLLFAFFLLTTFFAQLFSHACVCVPQHTRLTWFVSPNYIVWVC